MASWAGPNTICIFLSELQEIVHDKASHALAAIRNMQVHLVSAVSVERRVEGKSQRIGWIMSENEEEPLGGTDNGQKRTSCSGWGTIQREVCKDKRAEQFWCCRERSNKETSTGPTEDIGKAGAIEDADISKKMDIKDRKEQVHAPPPLSWNRTFAGICKFQTEGQDLHLNRQLQTPSTPTISKPWKGDSSKHGMENWRERRVMGQGKYSMYVCILHGNKNMVKQNSRGTNSWRG